MSVHLNKSLPPGVQEKRKKLGDRSGAPRVLKGPKCAGSYSVKHYLLTLWEPPPPLFLENCACSRFYTCFPTNISYSQDFYQNILLIYAKLFIAKCFCSELADELNNWVLLSRLDWYDSGRQMPFQMLLMLLLMFKLVLRKALPIALIDSLAWYSFIKEFWHFVDRLEFGHNLDIAFILVQIFVLA